jgi:multiple sugar transport system ATP-binding protein
MTEVQLHNVSKRFGSVGVLADLSLTIRSGELFVLLGPSGCGKSTLLNLIAGLERPSAGRICFDGEDVTLLPPRDRDIALVFQSYALYPHMTVGENLSFPLRVAKRKLSLTKAAIAEEVVRVAKLLDLSGVLARRPRELSGGQRQRVALGRALIRQPRVFLLDEPLSNLDAQLRAGMRAELRRLHDELGITMIHVTHDQTEAMTLADRLAVFNGGRLQQVGTPQDCYDAPANLFVAGFLGYPPMNLLKAGIEQGQIVAGPIRLPFPASLKRPIDGTTVTLGLRPEAVRVPTPGTAAHAAALDKGAVAGVVRLIEPTGGQTWVTFEVSEARQAQHTNASPERFTLVGQAGDGFWVKPGDRVVVEIAEAPPHLFDAETGMRLGRGSAPDPVLTEERARRM